MVGVIVIDVALSVAHVSVVVCPLLKNIGLAVNCEMVGVTGCATCTVTVCGAVVPFAPVAVAVYVVVCVGESATLPAACELVVTVRVEAPAVAVIVTDVAFVACQFNVTLCPALMELA